MRCSLCPLVCWEHTLRLREGSAVECHLIECRFCSEMRRGGPQVQGLVYCVQTAHLEKGCAVGPKQEGHKLLQVEAHAVEGSNHADVGLQEGGWQLPRGVGGLSIDAPALERGCHPQVAPAPCFMCWQLHMHAVIDAAAREGRTPKMHLQGVGGICRTPAVRLGPGVPPLCCRRPAVLQRGCCFSTEGQAGSGSRQSGRLAGCGHPQGSPTKHSKEERRLTHAAQCACCVNRSSPPGCICRTGVCHSKQQGKGKQGYQPACTARM